MGQILMRQSRNFSGGSFRSPAPGHTTTRSSTRLSGGVEKQTRKDSQSNHGRTIACSAGDFTYPRVLRNPDTLPSEYRDTMSPRCRKLTDPIVLSPIVQPGCVFVCIYYVFQPCLTRQRGTRCCTRFWVFCSKPRGIVFQDDFAVSGKSPLKNGEVHR